MDILILRTNINSRDDFHSVKNSLNLSHKINDCTIDLEDVDRVVRVIGENIEKDYVVKEISRLGFNCEELQE